MKNQMRNTTAIAAALIVAAGLGGPAWAQDSASSGDSTAAADAGGATLTDIIVTARKRSENLQSVPAAVSAVTGKELAASGVRQLNQISTMTSGFTFVQVGGAQPLISMRGDFNRLGFTEPGTGVFIDGVYITRFTQLGRGPFDAERVEVLKGPQSTLYGKNTIAGAVNIITGKPSFDWTGSVEAGYGGSSVDGDHLWHAQAMLSGPIVEDKIAFRIAGGHQDRDGYIVDRTNGYRALGYNSDFVRGKLLFMISDGVEWTLSASHISDNAPRAESIRFIPGNTLIFQRPGLPASSIPIFTDVWRWQGNLQPFTHSLSTSLTSELRIDTSVGAITYLANYQKSRFNQLTDFDVSGVDVAHQRLFDEARAMSHELRLAGSADRFNWLAGVYYLDDHAKAFGQTIFFDSQSVQRVVQGSAQQNASFPNSSKTYAAFGQLGFDLTDHFNILGGLRAAKDKRSSPFNFNVVKVDGTTAPGAVVDLQRKKTFNSVTGNLVATYKFNRDVRAYASFSTGNKSGGFSNAGTAAAAAIPYGEQTVTAYELGVKSELLDRRLRLNISAYYNDYKDLQVQRSISVNNALFNITQNAASATVPGVDVEIVAAPSEHFRVNATYSWQDAKISKYQIDPVTVLRNVPIPRSPTHSGSVGVTYMNDVGPGKLTLGADVSYKSDFTNDFAYAAASPATGGVPLLQTVPLDGYAIVGAKAAYEFDGWEVSGYIRNLFNKRYAVSGFAATATTFVYWVPGEPRTFELTLRKSF